MELQPAFVEVTMTEKTAVKFEQLGPNNYGVWSYRMKLVLANKQLWGAVDPGNLSAELDAQSLALIGMHVSDIYLPTIFECKTAKDAWTKLATMLQPASTARMLVLLRELNELRKERGERMVAYVNRAKQLMADLLGVGHTIQPKEMAFRLLAGLPSQYGMVVTVLEATPDLTFDVVVTRLIEAEAKLEKIEASEVAAYAAKINRSRARRSKGNNNGDSEKRCWCCGEAGHICRDCPARKVKTSAALAF